MQWACYIAVIGLMMIDQCGRMCVCVCVCVCVPEHDPHYYRRVVVCRCTCTPFALQEILVLTKRQFWGETHNSDWVKCGSAAEVDLREAHATVVTVTSVSFESNSFSSVDFSTRSRFTARPAEASWIPRCCTMRPISFLYLHVGGRTE